MLTKEERKEVERLAMDISNGGLNFGRACESNIGVSLARRALIQAERALTSYLDTITES